MRSWIWIAAVVSLLMANGPVLAAGVVLVIGDDWVFSDEAFSQNPDAATLARNVASIIKPSGNGSFLVYSTHFAINELGTASLAATLSDAGHSLTTRMVAGITVGELAAYDGVIVAGSFGIDDPTFTSYVNRGGSVVVLGGTGGSPPWWNSFLAAYDLALATDYPVYGGDTFSVIPDSSPLCAGVDVVTAHSGQNVLLLDPENPLTSIAMRIYDYNGDPVDFAAVSAPEPATLSLLAAGLSALFVRRRQAGK